MFRRVARSCCRRTARRPKSSLPHGPEGATWSIRCARLSPRSTTRSRSAPRRATESSTSVTKVTKRRSAPWRLRRLSISRVESVAEVDALPQFDQPVALLAQTTLSHRDWSGVADAVTDKYPDAWTPGRSDLCFATTNRQSALMAMAAKCDAIVVIGSSNSSNTRALEKLAIEAGCPQVFRVNHAGELPDDLHGTIGVTAGASAPEELVDEILRYLAPRNGVEPVKVTDEDEYFPPPRNIRELQAAIGTAAAALLGGSVANSATMNDHEFAASDVLAALRVS